MGIHLATLMHNDLNRIYATVIHMLRMGATLNRKKVKLLFYDNKNLL